MAKQYIKDSTGGHSQTHIAPHIAHKTSHKDEIFAMITEKKKNTFSYSHSPFHIDRRNGHRGTCQDWHSRPKQSNKQTNKR
jgi:hypothetical protein